MLEELLRQWSAHQNLTAPPPDPIRLWTNQTRVVYIEDKWGPAVPYPYVEHYDGTRNYGYVRLKTNWDAIGKIHEVQDWPELQQFLEVMNGPTSPIESLGCEIGFFPVEGEEAFTIQLGSYVDVAFSITALNQDPTNLLRLAAPLMKSVEGCEQWWGSVELGLQRLRKFADVAAPWGLMIRVCNHGRTKDDARRFWGETMRRLSDTITALPPAFPAPSEPS